MFAQYNPIIVGQLREVFASKLFQTAEERKRESMMDLLLKQPSVMGGPNPISREVMTSIMRQETVDKPLSMFNLMQEVRQVFQSRKFNDFSPEEKQRGIELILSQPQIISAGLTRDDLLRAYYEIEANTEAINKITKDPLFLIMIELPPRDVLTACQTTRQFARLCNNPSLFSALMSFHYPDFFETSDPKEQYKAITLGLETTYRLGRDDSIEDSDGREFWTTFKNPIQYGKTQAPWNIPGFKFQRSLWQINTLTTDDEIQKLIASGKLTQDQIDEGKPEDYHQDHDTEVVFSIKGYPIPTGTKAWLLILESHAYGIEDKVWAFKTKDALARWFIDNQYADFKTVLVDSFLDDIDEDDFLRIEGNPEEIDRFLQNSPQWKAYVDDHHLPYPFTRENVYKYLMAGDHIQIHPDSDRNSWLLREVTF